MQDVTLKNIRKRIKAVIFGGTFLLCKIQNHGTSDIQKHQIYSEHICFFHSDER